MKKCEAVEVRGPADRKVCDRPATHEVRYKDRSDALFCDEHFNRMEKMYIAEIVKRMKGKNNEHRTEIQR